MSSGIDTHTQAMMPCLSINPTPQSPLKNEKKLYILRILFIMTKKQKETKLKTKKVIMQ